MKLWGPLVAPLFIIWMCASLSSLGAKTLDIGLAGNFSMVVDSVDDPTLKYPRKAAELALKKYEAQLKSKDLQIQFQDFDYADNKIKTIQTAQSIAQSSVVAVVGYTNSSDALLAGPILQKAGVPFIAQSATAERLEEIGPFVRRACFDDAFQGRIMADFARNDLKLKRVAVISVSDCAYCQSLRASFKQRFLSLGAEVVFDEVFLSDDSNFASLIQSLKAVPDLDAIFFPNYERHAARVLPAFYDADIRPRYWLSGDGWGASLNLLRKTMGQRKYVAYGIAHWRPDFGGSESKKFYSDFKSSYHLEPNDTAALVYDSVSMLIESILKAKTISRDSILAELESFKTYEGASGNFNYPPGKRTPLKDAVLIKIENSNVKSEKYIFEIKNRKP